VRIVQEALDNVAAHAQARAVRMLLGVAEGKTLLTIRDDGIGSPPPTAKSALPRADWCECRKLPRRRAARRVSNRVLATAR
jgi:signal transduction histidine kinase